MGEGFGVFWGERGTKCGQDALRTEERPKGRRMGAATEDFMLAESAAPGDGDLKLSIVFPAYNEEARIRPSLRSAARFIRSLDFPAEIIVVDDGSADSTADIVREAQADHPTIRLIQHDVNQGKGIAVRTGFLASDAEFALFCDVDESVPIGELVGVLDRLIDEEADVAIGTRYHPDSVIVKRQPWQRIVVSRVGNLLIRALLLPGLKDSQCGFKLFRMSRMKQAFERVITAGFGFDLEILAIARAWKRKIIEVPVTWIHGEGSTLRLAPAATNVLLDLLRITWRVRTGFYREG